LAMETVKVIAAAVAALAAIAVPLIKWWLNSRSEKVKRQKQAYQDAAAKIDADADTADLQSDIDDLLNGL
jgi:hypothetical protein